jgi:sugar phosphate isomerase/epimerase
MKCKNWPIGVCSWSLQTDVDGVAEAMKKIGLEHVHLGIRVAIGAEGADVLAAIQRQNWTITSTMIDFPQEDYSTLDTIKVTGGVAPDDCWEQNRDLFIGAVDVTVKLGVKYLSMHAGFVDESDAAYARKFYDRITCLADAAAEKDLLLLLETGQETAEELKHFLEELNHPAIGVNFDPANMILYDKSNPIEAVKVLAPWIKHIHIKDATRTKQPGTWGAEVPWGDGEVQPEAFLNALSEIGFNGALAIEREAGDNRVGDVQLAAERLTSMNG